MITVLRQLPRKIKNHQPGETGRDEAFPQYAVDGGAHENRLVRQRPNLQLRRKLSLDSRQHALDPGNDVEGRGVPGFLDGQQGRPLPVHAHNVGLRREAVAHESHVADVDGGASLLA